MKPNTMLFVKNLDTTKVIEPLFLLRHHVTQYKTIKTYTDRMQRLTLKDPMQTTFNLLKKIKFDFFFFQKY